jgi:hypothetical protein
VLLIGTDIPSLTPGDLAEAASLVADDVLVIGPAADGGYYLIGTTRDEPSLFEGVEWGTGHVTRDTIRRVQEDGTCWLGGTTWHGVAAMRVNVSNWSTTNDDIDVSADAIVRCYREAQAAVSRR